MAGITSGVGLISGFPIQDTVDKLMQIAARPRELLVGRNKQAQEEQTAISKLQALILALQVNIQKLMKADAFDKRKATSSDEKLLGATVTGTPTPGTYTFTPVRLAQNQQLISSALASNNQPLGAGTFSFRFGG